jgi:hypothetical protein
MKSKGLHYTLIAVGVVAAACVVVGALTVPIAPANAGTRLAESALRPQPAQPAADPALTAAVRATLDQDPHLADSNIEVAAVGGVITLRGWASDSSARSTAETLARNIEGVRSVNDDIGIMPTSVSDMSQRHPASVRPEI